jgi:DNA-binding transcriptional MerR regulator
MNEGVLTKYHWQTNSHSARLAAVTAAIYSIGAVARMLGVPTATLRTWEERYGVVMPDRSPGGHRLYTRDDVEQLRFVLRNIEGGMQPADAHRLLTDRLNNDPDRNVAMSGSEPRFVIMLAQRDPHAAELAEYFLRTEGYQTIMALGAREAEAVFEERSPHLAVVDLLIPGGAGPGLCRTFRERGALVLAISPLESRDEALEYGADAFLQKPLDPLRLVSTVKDLLGQSAFLRTEALSP